MLKVILQKWKLDCGTAGEEDWVSQELPGLECICCYLIFLDIVHLHPESLKLL